MLLNLKLDNSDYLGALEGLLQLPQIEGEDSEEEKEEMVDLPCGHREPREYLVDTITEQFPDHQFFVIEEVEDELGRKKTRKREPLCE